MRTARPKSHRLAALTAALIALSTGPASALEMPDFEMPDFGSWEGSRAQEITASAVDLAIVRPIATARVVVGSMLFVPAALFSAPMGREGFDGALDTLITAPKEFAFDREIGDL